MMNKKTVIITSLLTILPCFFGLALWNVLPESIPVHWNFKGEIDDYASKAFAVFFIPLFILAAHLICVFATRLDTAARNVSSKVMGLMLWVCPCVSIFCSAACFMAALDYSIRVELVIPLLVGVLFLAIGNYMPKCKRNRVIGIKIPYTLGSDENWNATHRFAGRLWSVCSLVIIAGAFFGSVVVYTTFISIAVMVIAPLIYSYIYYRKHR